MTVSVEKQYTAGFNPPFQHQSPPGLQSQVDQQPFSSSLIAELNKSIPTIETYKAAGKLQGKVALITGGDSGIGKSVAILFAMEGANVAINYLKSEEKEAQDTKKIVEKNGKKCILIPGDLGQGEKTSKDIINKTVQEFGQIDILVNNAATQMEKWSIEELSEDEIEQAFKVNVISMFSLTKYALQFMKPGSSIINTTSINAYKGHPQLNDYSATKGAILAFTKSLALQLVNKGIRVNAVAPGPIWTPLIPATLSDESLKKFGSTVPMQRPGQPVEVATSYVFLASNDSTYFTGQTFHPNGGITKF